jgi:hypothetical protein
MGITKAEKQETKSATLDFYGKAPQISIFAGTT